MKCEILKIMNNNVIWVQDDKNKAETVLIGKGIGFGVKPGQQVDIPQEAIDKVFITYDQKTMKDYIALAESIDSNIMEVCTEIIIYAEEKLGKLSHRVYPVLTDHIAFAIERLKSQMVIQNPFLMEIKGIYQDEFEIGLRAQSMILKKIGIDITEDEVGFIALHLNAARENKEVKEIMKNTRLIKTVIDNIEAALDYKVDMDSFTYQRLVSHIKGSIERARLGQTIKNPLLESIKVEFANAYIIAAKIRTTVERELSIKISDDEVGYMAIHIARISNKAEL
ncbi:Antitermination protein BlgG [Petrocella atlantisensis]|uniref:Antitermination protein BlgG n=1 Tax=Petrocella atlantisensis TaxID=2173034 RepID=A0A3P7NWM6_9FIRM|nr:PRD domain-containing protein [Petrocella atlantisensis]VDN47624.1 Antitermination protein BlgG [Petrocella atlantisensis]